MPSGRRANLARKSRPFRLNEKRGLSGSASPLEVSRWPRPRGHLPGLFVDRQITRAPRDCSLVRIDQTCFGRSGGVGGFCLVLQSFVSFGENDQHGLSANVLARPAASGY
jgi:hypothetical protein